MERRRNRLDLHIHSTASDGELTPSEVVCLALGHELDAIALTDHDTLSGVAEAQQAAVGTGLEVIAGVEINAEGDWGDLHFLGYYIDLENAQLQEQLQALRDARVERARNMLGRLRDMGMTLEWEAIQALAGGGSIGRLHVARALLDEGYIRTVQEAFDRFIGRDGPAYVPRLRLTPPEAIGIITEARGIPVIAHPLHSGLATVERIPEFTGYGLRGVEVYYPHHSSEDVEMLQRLCRDYRLLLTGGSDFHGQRVREGVALGSVFVPWECVERLRRTAEQLQAGSVESQGGANHSFSVA